MMKFNWKIAKITSSTHKLLHETLSNTSLPQQKFNTAENNQKYSQTDSTAVALSVHAFICKHFKLVGVFFNTCVECFSTKSFQIRLNFQTKQNKNHQNLIMPWVFWLNLEKYKKKLMCTNKQIIHKTWLLHKQNRQNRWQSCHRYRSKLWNRKIHSHRTCKARW